LILVSPIQNLTGFQEKIEFQCLRRFCQATEANQFFLIHYVGDEAELGFEVCIDENLFNYIAYKRHGSQFN